jgi:haloalkane dehalogenase
MTEPNANAEDWQAEYPFTPHYVSVNGHRLHVVDRGAGPAVLMLHGNPTWSFMYRHLVRALSPSLRVIAPDHLGCGLSDKPQDWPYRLSDHIANLEALVDEHLRLDRFSLVVHDWGGPIGMGYAVLHPERIDRLVLLNTAAFLLHRCPWRIRICKLPVFGPLAVRGANAFARAAITMAVGKGHCLSPAARAGMLRPYDTWRNRIAILRFVQDIPLNSRHPTWDLVATIQKNLHLLADRPVLICWGTQDFCFNEPFLEVWQRYFPRAQVHRFADAGHYLLEDAADRVVPLVQAFLEASEAQPQERAPDETNRHYAP